MRIAKTLLLLVLGLSCAGIAQLTTLARQQGSQETAADAVKLLWSSDDSERETARQKLLQLGSAAIQPLISLLKDIREKPPRRFATGKEQEGEEAWEQARRIPKEYNGEEWAEALRKFHRLEITARLQRDAVDILVNLRSDEAIVLLIEAISETPTGLGTFAGELILLDDDALIRFGELAVPYLISALEQSLAATPSVKVNGVAHRSGKLGILEPAPPIHRRAAVILGEIGDARALPILERLKNETNNPHLIPVVQEAIARIRLKNSTTEK